MAVAAVRTEPVWGVPQRRHPGGLPDRADVVIVGGGITGLALLRSLPGAVLVERDHVGAGASGRNAGFLRAGVGASYLEATRRYGRERARSLWAFTAETHDLLAEALAGRARGYRRCGGVAQSAGPEEARELEESAELLREDGFEAGWDGERLCSPRDGELDPVEALLVLAADAPPGAIREGVAVEAIEPSTRGVRVHGAGAECLAGAVVLATNADTALLAPQVPIRPVRAQMTATAPERRPVAERPVSANRGFRYWRQLPDGRVLAGGYRDRALEEEVGRQPVTTPLIQGHLDAHLHELGVAAPVTNRWAGIMGFTPDELPVVGAVPGWPGVYVCGGYSGHGLSFAFHCARRLAGSL
jgi:gamma-glutamylputrescine oxidase